MVEVAFIFVKYSANASRPLLSQGGEMSKRLGGIIGYKNTKPLAWHLRGFFPDGSNIGSTDDSAIEPCNIYI